MALNIPGTQIYAGRYHHGNIKTPDLFQEAGKTEPSKTRYLKDEVLKDTVTFSDEGLAKSKNWREYLKDDLVMVSSFHYQKQREELNKQLHTVNIIDSVSMFQCELGEVASGIEAEYKKGEHFSSKEEFLDVMEKSYQIIYSRIERDCRISGTGRFCRGKCGAVPVAGGSGPHLFFQSFFFGNFTESDGAYPGILL